LHYLQTQDVQVTINIVMVPERFEELWGDAVFFHELGINTTLKPQSDETASRVVDGYTPSMLRRLHNGMPQMDYTEQKRQVRRPIPNTPDVIHKIPVSPDPRVKNGSGGGGAQHYQIEMEDRRGNTYFIDQAERLNAHQFNRFTHWTCSSGYRSIIIREPDGSVRRSYSCRDVPLGNIRTGFSLFKEPRVCSTDTCVSSADSKIPKRKPTSRARLWSN